MPGPAGLPQPEGPARVGGEGEPRLIAADGTETRLTSLPPASVRVGWGELLVLAVLVLLPWLLLGPNPNRKRLPPG